MFWIAHSVGRHGANRKPDVLLVQSLLNRHAICHTKHLVVDGLSGPNTLAAIIVFQRMIGFHHPDGLIQPGGRTWAALNDPFLLQGLKLSLEGAIHSIESVFLNPLPPRQTVRQNDLEFYDWDKHGAVTPANFSAHPEKLCWGNKVAQYPDFKEKLFQVAKDLGGNPDYLMACMHLESAGTFSPSIRNPSTNAVGLIQILPDNAIPDVGVSADQLASMSATQQLGYVEKYFQTLLKEFPSANISTLLNTYLIILRPGSYRKTSRHNHLSGGVRQLRKK